MTLSEVYKNKYGVEPAVVKDDLCISRWHDYTGKKILVVGGGPTTNEMPWDHTKYDHVFSCNHFFLHPLLSIIPVDFACLSPEVDVRSSQFLNYYHLSNTHFCIENPDKYNINHTFLKELDEDRLTLAELGVKVKVGGGAHLLILATMFNPSEIHFVGIDGFPKEDRLPDGIDSGHAFQAGKKKHCKLNTYEEFRAHYKKLWDYLFKIGANVKYVNLGKGHPYNISSEFI